MDEMKPIQENTTEAEATELDRLKEELRNKDAYIRKLENRKPVVVEKKVSVPPPDYEYIKNQAARMQKQLKKYQQLLAFGGTSNLSILIEGFAEKAKSSLKKIAMEIENTNYDQQQIQRIIKLCDFLDQSREELYSFIATADEGKFVTNPDFRRVQQDIRLITARLNERGTIYQIPEESLKDFHHTLLSVLEAIKPFLSQGERGGVHD